MKIFGVSLLIINFLWLAWSVFLVGPITRSVMLKQYEVLEDSDISNITKEEIQKHIREPVIELNNRLPNYIFPGIGMLVGGLIVFFSKPKKSVS